MKKEEMASELASEFMTRGYEWKFSDEDFNTRVPEYDDILEALDFAEEKLEDGHSLIAGRLVITKSDGHTDVYLHIGEVE